MTDHLTEADRALCGALEHVSSPGYVKYSATNTRTTNALYTNPQGPRAATRIRELSRQLHEAEADAGRLAEALGAWAQSSSLGAADVQAQMTEALASHTARLIDG